MQGKSEQVVVTMRQIYTEDMNEILSSDVVIAKIQDENIKPILEAKAREEAKKVASTKTTITSRSSSRASNKTNTTKSSNTEIAVEKGNGVVKIECVPVSGTISSKFGERSSRRSSAHTGLDIAKTLWNSN